MNSRGRQIVHSLIVLLALILASYLGLRTTLPPEPPKPASSHDFSVDNAMAHVRAIASQSHPVESPTNDKVRQYLVDELSKLGLRVELQIGTVFGRKVQNIIGRLDGSLSANQQPSKIILLCCHYDSVPAGPGASDDGAAVGALLETMRVLTAGPPLKEDVLLLITDGEEAGLLGARMFCSDVTEGYKFNMSQVVHDPALQPYPDLDRVALVINFDARGTSGPSIMYETAPANLELIRHFAAAAPNPVANSLSYDVYKMLRNDSDFTIFRRSGKQGLNFGFIANYFYYHTKNDSAENLNPASLYHDGAYALALTRHFASLDPAEVDAITAPAQSNAVYFNIPGGFVIHYPATLIWPLTVAQLLLTSAVVFMAFHKHAVTWAGVLGSCARLVVALLVTPGLIFGLMKVFSPPQAPAAFDWQLIAYLTLSMVVAVAAALSFRRSSTALDLAVSAILVFSLLAIVMNIYMPGGSFLTLWLPLFATVSLAAALFFPPISWGRTLFSTIGMLPIAFIMVPLVKMVFVALTLQLAFAVAPLVVLMMWILLATLLPAVTSSSPRPDAHHPTSVSAP